MTPRIDEVADRVYRISTFLPPEAVPPRGFTFNQFLIDAVSRETSALSWATRPR
jgi:hypothetical protein